MTVLQSIAISQDSIKMRWKEPYITSGLNQKALATSPKGVLAGFTVVPSAGYVVSLPIDPSLNLSIANVLESAGAKFSVTIVQGSNLLVDLTAQANTTVYIALDVQFTVGTSTAAQVKVVDAAELGTNPDLVVLAKVNVPAAPPISATHINMGYRTHAGDITPRSAFPRLNLVNNPTFETATTVGWSFTGFDAATASTDTAKTGSYSLKLTKAVAGSCTATSTAMPVLAGLLYRVSAWVRSTGGAPITGGNGAKIQLSWRDAADAQIGSVVDIETAFTGGGTTFLERKAELTAPALAVSAKFLVFYDNCSGTLYVDDVECSTQTYDSVMRSQVFGGATVLADAWHTHSAAGMSYGGSPNWADGTSIAAGTIEAAIDAIPTAIGGASGAAKMGFTPATPKDLTATRVDNAINELDDKKASLALANTFDAVNTFASASSNTSSILATGNGTGSGVSAVGGATGPVSAATAFQGAGVRATGGAGNGVGLFGAGGNGALGTSSLNNTNIGVYGVGASGGGIGYGVFGLSGTQANTAGVVGHASDGSNGHGVIGTAKGTGSGGIFSADASGVGVRANAPSANTTAVEMFGGLKTVGANPSFSVAFTNQLMPSTIVKAWARVNFASGVSSIVSGFNVTSITDTDLANGVWTLNLANTITKATRATWVIPNTNTFDDLSVDFGGGTDTTIGFGTVTPAGSNRDLTAAGPFVYVVLVFGLQ